MYVTRVIIIVLLFALCGCWAIAAQPVFVPTAPEVQFYAKNHEQIGMVPLEPLAKLFDLELTHAANTSTVVRGGKSFSCTPGSFTARANNADVTLPLAPFQHADSLYVPLRSLMDALGGTVERKKIGGYPLAVVAIGKATLSLPVTDLYGSPGKFAAWIPEIYLVGFDGAGLQRLSYNSITERLPALSSDGSSLAYYAGETAVLRRVNKPEILLSTEAGLEPGTTPSFSRDGKRVLFERYVSDDNLPVSGDCVTIANSDGSGLQSLVRGTNPSFSPDGKTIAFDCFDANDPYNNVIWLMDTDGKNQRTPGKGNRPRFSVDGRWLYFTRQSTHGTEHLTQVVLYGLTGAQAGKSTVTSLGTARIRTANVCVSPDGAKILFNTSDPGTGLRLVPVGRSEVQQLSTVPGDAHAIFTADGAQIVFIRENGRPEAGDLYVMPATGGKARQLTVDFGVEDFTLTPDSRQIIFTALSPQAPKMLIDPVLGLSLEQAMAMGSTKFVELYAMKTRDDSTLGMIKASLAFRSLQRARNDMRAASLPANTQQQVTGLRTLLERLTRDYYYIQTGKSGTGSLYRMIYSANLVYLEETMGQVIDSMKRPGARDEIVRARIAKAVAYTKEQIVNYGQPYDTASPEAKADYKRSVKDFLQALDELKRALRSLPDEGAIRTALYTFNMSMPEKKK